MRLAGCLVDGRKTLTLIKKNRPHQADGKEALSKTENKLVIRIPLVGRIRPVAV